MVTEFMNKYLESREMIFLYGGLGKVVFGVHEYEFANIVFINRLTDDNSIYHKAFYFCSIEFYYHVEK